MDVSGEEITKCVDAILAATTDRFSLSPIDCDGGNQAEYSATSVILISQAYQCASGYMVALPGTSSSGCGKAVSEEQMSLVMRKPVFGVSDQVPHKPGCTATEDD